MTAQFSADALSRFRTYCDRHANGDEPMQDAARLRAWLLAHRADFAPMMECDLKTCAKIVYDFSTNGDVVIGATSDPARQTEIMWQQLADAKAPVGIGRYGENRICYQSDQFKTDGEARSQHLGIDLFAPAGTPVFAPLDGIIHSFADNNLHLDYGPTIILEHNPEPDIRFYTLYGHLSKPSLEGLYPGKTVRAGELLCRFGDFPINGDWIPHLHFQIIFDMLGREGDYFGAAKPSEWTIWSNLCPNPNLILQMPENVTATQAGA
ncbi:peptidoglycan DD-metalloendopeptidase family protein [Thalassospira sp. MA62]|nr:peptidoglycan DD-metalloendopeptidase family protein [Thalassospira sp. MA62]